MAWPPPVLPTNRTDATPQQTTHPADHNAANLAINDLTTRVQFHESNLLIQQFPSIADLRASGLPVGSSGIIMNDPRWGVLTRYPVGWVGTRTDLYSGTTDGAGRVSLSIASFGFSSVYSVTSTMSLGFQGTDIANLMPEVRVVGPNFEFFFFKVDGAFGVRYDANKAVQFVPIINGVVS